MPRSARCDAVSDSQVLPWFVGRDPTRRQAVHPNPIGVGQRREPRRHADHASLCHVVPREPSWCLAAMPQGGDRRDVHHRASTAAAHRLDGPPSRMNGTEEVRLQCRRPVFEPVASPRSRRVVDQDVETAESRFRERHQGPRVRLLAHVGPKEGGTASSPLDHADRFVATGLVDVGNDDGGSRGREATRDGAAASSATGSGHHDHAQLVRWSRQPQALARADAST